MFRGLVGCFYALENVFERPTNVPRLCLTAKDFIKMLLIVTPSLRMTAAQALAHPFLNTAAAAHLHETHRQLLTLGIQTQTGQPQSQSPYSLSNLSPSAAKDTDLLEMLQQMQILKSLQGS